MEKTELEIDLKEYKKQSKLREKTYKRSKKAALKQDKAGRREFKKTYGIPKHPLMADVFDLIEGERAEPNGRTPFHLSIKVEKNVVYKTVDGGNLVMDVYYPTSFDTSDSLPCIMDIPGGGWVIHNRERRDGYARCLAALGAVVAVIDHRLSPETIFPENLKDCIDAYNYLSDNSERFHIDKNNISVTGDSSGGHLSACLGLVSSSKEFREKLEIDSLRTPIFSIIFISGAFDFEVMYRIPFTHSLMVSFVSRKKSRKEFRNWEFYKEINVYNYLNEKFPPSYNNGGATDFLCLGEAKRMAGKLTALNVDNEYYVSKNFFNCMHCYVLRTPFKNARKDMLKIFEWYVKRERNVGVDLTSGLQRVERFFNNYKKALKGRIEL